MDMDAFYASVEQLDFPKLRGKAVAVGGGTQRGVVAAASYEARKYGVRSAMSNAEALRRCPHIVFVNSRSRRYKEISQKLMTMFHEYTDLVEPLSIDEAFLDVTENKKEEPYAMSIAEEIRSRVKKEFGLTVSAGISYNKFLAKTASDVNKPDGMFVITPKRAQQFLDILPIRRFYGVGKVTAKKMLRLGIENGKDLKEFSEKDLVRHFGKVGHFYYNIVRGVDNRPVQPHRVRKSIGTEETFSTDIVDREQVVEALEEIARELNRRAMQKRVGGYTLTLKVKYSDFKKISRSRTYDNLIYKTEVIENASLYLWDKIPLEQGIRLLGITLSKLTSLEDLSAHEEIQKDLFSDI